MPVNYPDFLQAEILGNPIAANLMKSIQEGVKTRYAGDTAKINNYYKKALADYYQSPALQMRGLTPLGKTFVEGPIAQRIRAQQLAQGGNPGQYGGVSSTQSSQGGENSGMEYNADGTNAVDDGSNSTQQNNYPRSDIDKAEELKRLRETTDSKTRDRNLFSTNIEKTLDFINPDHLVQYSGPKGHVKMAWDAASSAMGKPSPEYDNYLMSVEASHLLAKQIRQFYGDSIQPSMEAKIEKLVDPTGWLRDPKTAKKLFNQTKDILGKEMQTLRDATESTDVYKGKGKSSTAKSTGRTWKLNRQTGRLE